MWRTLETLASDLVFDRRRSSELIRRLPLLPLALAAISGIVAARCVPLDPSIGSLVLLACALASFWVPVKYRWIGICLVFLLMFSNRYHRAVADYESADVLRWVTEKPQPVVVRGVIDAGSRLRRNPLADSRGRRDVGEHQSVISVRLTELRLRRDWVPTGGRVLMVLDVVRNDLLPGDQVEAYGSISGFALPTNPGAPDFRDVFRRKGYHGRMSITLAEQLILLRPGGVSVQRLLASVADGCRQELLRHTTESTSPLAIALVTGQRDLVDDRTSDLLLVTGTAHLLSVSGLHLAIVVLMVKYTTSRMGVRRDWQFILIIAVGLCYIVITGSRPPVIRASVLIGMVIVAFWIRRPNQSLNALALAALGLLYYNPLLLFGIGMQLSFLAVGTLLARGYQDRAASVRESVDLENSVLALAEQHESRGLRLGRSVIRYLRQSVEYSLAVSVATLPLVWNQFNVVSPISVIANVALGLALIPALCGSIATVLCGWVWAPLGAVCGAVCDGVLFTMVKALGAMALVPCGHFWLPSPGGFWVATFYVGIALLFSLRTNPTVRRIRWFCVVGWVLAGWMIAVTPSRRPPGMLEVTFVDVGHGTAVILRLPDGEVWLYDCGRLGNDSGQSRDIDTALWDLGVCHLDGVFLSHADSDHFNALPGLLRRFSVDRIVTPPGMLREDESAIRWVRRAIEHAGVPTETVFFDPARSGVRSSGWNRGNGRSGVSRPSVEGGVVESAVLPDGCEVLHPRRDRIAGSDNANSLVLKFHAGGRCLLLPGDLEAPGTAMLLRLERPTVGGVLMSPHHGSLNSDSTDVVLWSRPAVTVVSGGRRAARPEVTELLSRGGSEIHVTSRVGAVRVRISADGGLCVERWAESTW